MCTFILLYGLLEEYPVIGLHNRYLGLDTKEKPPMNWGDGVFAPYDYASEGTWFGFNRDGLMMAITNQETQLIDMPGRSRGLLSLDVLRECSSAKKAKDYLNDKSIREQYRTGNFILADSESAYHVLWDAVTVNREIKPGPYSVGVVTRYPGLEITNRAMEVFPSSESRRLRAYRLLSEFRPNRIGDAVSKMMEVSADHEYGKTQGSICWHSDKFRQTSSTLIALGSDPLVYYCESNHCENPFNKYDVEF